MRVRAALLAAVLLAPGCGGGASGPTDPSASPEILVIAIARSDRSLPEEDTLEGYLAFFFDLEGRTLLNAAATIDRVDPDGTVVSRPLSTEITPGLVPGVGYVAGVKVDPGRRFQLEATVTAPDGSPVRIVSEMATVPSAFEIDIPEDVVSGQPLGVTWSVTGAERVNVAVDGGVFSAHVPASQGSFTIPASAFEGRHVGEGVNIEITAYNTFYEPLGGAISNLTDAEAAVEEFRGVDNVNGALGVFGAAFTLGHEVVVR